METFWALKPFAQSIINQPVSLQGVARIIAPFSQFKMDATNFFRSAQRRKANEGVRIANLNPDTRMNSCNEFRQGTNITMRPVRGVGV